MSEMISIATGFQYSVNIGYDLSSDDKLRNFIPTQSALRLLEEILLSTAGTSTEAIPYPNRRIWQRKIPHYPHHPFNPSEKGLVPFRKADAKGRGEPQTPSAHPKLL